MTPEQYRAAIEAIGWTNHGLASRLGVNAATTRQWASGKREIPEAVALWLEWLANAHNQAPLPIGW